MADVDESGGRFVHFEALRTVWLPVARELELSDGPVARTVCGEQVVLFLDADGRPAALPDRCSHRNAPLSAGRSLDGCVECPYHGWVFDGDGQCVSIPSSGPDATVPPKAHLPAHPCVARYGLVWICLGEPATGIPESPWEDDPSFRRINTPVVEWQASATRMVDNFMDISHFPWVHVGSFGAAAELQVPPIEIGDLPDGFVGYAYGVEATNEGSGTAASGQEAAVVHREMSTGFVLPFCVRSTIAYDTGLEHNLYLLTTPIDDERSLFTFIVWRNDDFSVHPDDVLQLDHLIASEDRAMLEKVPGPLPLGNDGVVSVQSDRPSVEWKRRFRAFLEGAPVSDGELAARPR